MKDEGQQRFTRADTLGEDYTAERIAEQIEQIQKGRTAFERLAEKKNTEKPVTPPTPVVTPKTEPTMLTKVVTPELLAKIRAMKETQAPKPTITPTEPQPTADKTDTAKSEYVYKPTSDEEFFNAFGVHLDEVDTPDTTKPTESQVPETEEVAPWAEIRDMGKADEIIADLEAGGIESVAELRGFFFNTPRDDDHTKELTELKKKIIATDTLVEKMKHRDEIALIYKEYKSKSGWVQSRFKKKNAGQIEDYEETVAYIKEHIKSFYVDSKAHSIQALEKKSNDLKGEYNALVPEHNTFIKKKNAADKHKKKVHKYLDDQMVKRHTELSALIERNSSH